MTKLYLATPLIDDMVSGIFAFSRDRLLHFSMQKDAPFEIEIPHHQYNCEIVRARSRFLQDFLDSDCTHILWVDADTDFTPQAVEGLVHSGLDFVCVPYPRKRFDHWGLASWINAEIETGRDFAARPVTGVELDVWSTSYPVNVERGMTGEIDPLTFCTEVAGVGIGLTLMSRSCCERLRAHYMPEFGFIDQAPGKPPRETCALFHQVFVGTPRTLLGEDLSIMLRWRQLGEKVWLYLGPGSPASHHGTCIYPGHPESFHQPQSE